MELFAQLTAWAGFLSGQLAVAEIDERTAEAVLEAAEATALIRGYAELDASREVGPRGGVTEVRATMVKAHRDLDPDVILQKQSIAERYAYRKLVGVLFTNVERDAALVSRELTRRTGSYEAKPRRESRWRP
jgi:hypothetical protein